MTIKPRDCWGTPLWLIRAIERSAGRVFDLDACAEPSNAKARTFLCAQDDPLRCDWRAAACAGEQDMPMIWMNPPYSDPARWCEKAMETALAGAIVVGLLRNDPSARWFERFVMRASHVVIPVGRRIQFEPPVGVRRTSNSGTNVLPVWTPIPPYSVGPAVRWLDVRGAIAAMQESA